MVEMSRRKLLSWCATFTGTGATAAVLFSESARNRITERAKLLARLVRTTPGLGYSGEPRRIDMEINRQMLLKAEEAKPGYWVGAPSLEYDEKSDRLLVHVRHRNPANRGHTVSIYELRVDKFELVKLIDIQKEDLGARSMEGGEIVTTGDEIIWYISYQHGESDDWRILKKRAESVEGLSEGTDDLDLSSNYYHNKDPTIVDGNLYITSATRDWLQSAVEKISTDGNTNTATEMNVSGRENVRVTTGGIVQQEILADVWPDFPRSEISNVLWTGDERAATGKLMSEHIIVDSNEYFISPSGGSITYFSAEMVDNSIVLLWQEQSEDGADNLVGATIGIDEYRDLFVDI